MRRRVSAIVILATVLFAVPLLAVSSPPITGTISGIELCPQDICKEAIFAGNFAGTINRKATVGVFWTGITHDDLQEIPGAITAITGGTWTIRTRTRVYAGVVQPGGTLTFNANNTFTVSLTMVLTSGGTGTMDFTGLLDHNPFPPTIVGSITQ